MYIKGKKKLNMVDIVTQYSWEMFQFMILGDSSEFFLLLLSTCMQL